MEMAAWGAAMLTIAYILIDRLSQPREFTFFRVGCDFFLLGYVIVGAISSFEASTTFEGIATIGGLRWVILLYAITYCWELFPGLNRAFMLLVASSVVAAAYAMWQHFTGVDLLRGSSFPSAPVAGAIYFVPSSFFNTPEILGTLLAMTLPFPAAAFLFADRKARWERWFTLSICVFLSIAILWTYRPGMWIAGVAGLLVAILMQARQAFSLLVPMAIALIIVLFACYRSPEAMFSSVTDAEQIRAERQRTQINTQVELWQESVWTGVGRKAKVAANYDPGTGNVYFQVLAQTGALGASFYLLFILSYLLATYRIFQEIPRTHYWHRVLIVGGLASQMAFHIAGLYWSTLAEALAFNLFVLVVSAISYLSEHYSRGLVPDDYSL